MTSSEHALVPGAVYLVALCSGEQRHWRYLGTGGTEHASWQDLETSCEFAEASVLYAWTVVRRLG